MYGDRAMAEQDERKGDRGAEAARPADACADLLWDRSPATAEAVARFFARTIGGDARYISHGEIQGGLSDDGVTWRSEEHTSELQSLMRISYAVFCLKKKNNIR